MSRARTVPEEVAELTDKEAIKHLGKGFPVNVASRITLKPSTSGGSTHGGVSFVIGDTSTHLDRHECSLIAEMLLEWLHTSQVRNA